MLLIFVLLAIYQLKHFLADYPLQRPWMLKKFLGGRAWIAPLAAHAGVHGLFTFLIAFVLMSTGWWFALQLAILDFGIHFVMDRIKASPKLMGRWKALSGPEYMIYADTVKVCCRDNACGCPGNADYQQAKKMIRGNTYFWWALGLDQMVHHFTHYLIIWLLVH